MGLRDQVKLVAIFLVLGLVLTARGEVYQTYWVERTDVLGGKNLGAGPYERLVARVLFRVDPKLEANSAITDIELAPVNEEGQVEFSADVYVLKPRDPRRGNGTVLFDVVNRGNKTILRMFNRAPGSNDPRTEEEMGDGFLMEQGYTLVWLGWQFDAPEGNNRMRLTVPVVAGVTGLARSTYTPNKKETSFPLGDRGHTPYALADPDDAANRLSVRENAIAQWREIPRSEWGFSADGTSVERDAGFEPGQTYEVVYKAKDPALAGLGPAAVRDIISFLKYGVEGRRAFVLGDQRAFIKRAIGFGTSQSGRFLRTFLYQGFNRDEKGRQVFDGLWPHVAGGGRGSFNHRFAQPSRSWDDYPTDLFPFTDLEQRDPETGRTDGLLRRAQRDQVVPRIFYTNTSAEYYTRAASPIHTTADGKRDAPIAPNTRIYMIAGAQHGPGRFPPPHTATVHPANPNDYRWMLRALLTGFQEWLAEGKEPPPSRYPRIADGTLVPLNEVKFPAMPGVTFPTWVVSGARADYGPDFASKGIVGNQPPKLGKPFPALVPQVDADGIDLGGFRLPVVAVPLGTFTGWNQSKSPNGLPGNLIRLTGSYLPFPRARIDERYASRDAYLAALREAAEKLAKAGFLLSGDIRKVVEDGGAQWDYVMR